MNRKVIIILVGAIFLIGSLIINLKFDGKDTTLRSQENCTKCKSSATTERFNGNDTILTPVERLHTFEEIMKLDNDEDISYLNKNRNLLLSPINPWVQKAPIGIEDISQPTSEKIYYSGRVFSLSYCESEFFYKGLLVGAGGGGLWRQDGSNFIPIGDKLPSPFIGAVAIDPSYYNRIFVGTGHIHEAGGAGVFRTNDGGLNWEQMSLPSTPSGVARILILGNLVLVASDIGIFKSSNMGNSWEWVLNIKTTDISNASDGSYFLAGCPIYGVYKSTDQGSSWELLVEPFTSSGLPLPGDNLGRVSVQISKSNKNIAYALIGYSNKASFIGIYKTTDKGLNWKNVSPTANVTPKFFGQPNFNNVILINPSNPNVVWAGGVLLIRTSDGGSTWNEVGATTNYPRLVHPDIHALLYVGDSLFVGGDGGVFVTSNEGASWSYSYNRCLPISIFHNFAIDKIDGKLQVGGMQDNGIAHNSRTNPDYWVMPTKGDGIDASITALPSNYFYGVCNGGTGNVSRVRYYYDGTNIVGINQSILQAGDTMMNFWNGRICVDPLSESKVYTNADNYVYWSTNYGNNWSRMNSSPLAGTVGEVNINKDGSSLYAPTNGSSQRIVRFDKMVTTWSMVDLDSKLPTSNTLKRISTSNKSNDIVYVLMNNVDTGRIYMSTNRGLSWKNITGNLPPKLSIYDIVDHPEVDNVLIIGTEMGCYLSINSGANWWRWSSGMPAAVRVKDLELTNKNGEYYVIAATWGRSTFERPISGINPNIELSFQKQYFPFVNFGQIVQCSVWVKNTGNADLSITSVYSPDTSIIIRPIGGVILPSESLKFYFTFVVPERIIGNFNKEIFFEHDAGGPPEKFSISGFVGDPTSYRTFPPESLIVKKGKNRKTSSNTWCFVFDNNCENRYGAKGLYVEFKNTVLEILDSYPFHKFEKLDEKGKKWKFFDGMVDKETNARICVVTKKIKEQIVTKWWWIADIATWEDDFEVVREGILCGINGKKLSETFLSNVNMPNTANFREEVFNLMPFNKENQLIIGVQDPDAKSKRVAYVAFTKHNDLYGSLTTGRSGKTHDGPPRKLDFFNDGKKMIGPIKKLTPDKQNNRLFAELIAFKLNLYASDLGITPPFKEEVLTGNSFKKSVGVEPSPWRTLRYKEIGHALNNKHLHEIDSLANIYMTYGDSSQIGSAEELYSAIYKINRAFVGTIDTVSFATRLVFTGVKPIAEVPFLERDETYRPVIKSQDQIAHSIPDEFELYQNYPNPFNPITTIEFYFPVSAIVTLKIYDIIGREVVTLIDRQEMDEGHNYVEFEARDLASGIYFYRITAEYTSEDESGLKQIFVESRKMLLLK
ncbi:MAG: hypothetical protein IGBAC_1482 [Ignavibacteriae bacterium]|nr:MAG: hypothetical protein IGBAC_1482 [Ignavibacteriota bacterium]